MLDELVGTTALVTGAARGIGRACAQALLARGARTVYAVDREPGEPLEGTIGVDLDVSDEKAVERFFHSLKSPVHVLVNSAGIFATRRGLDVERASWLRTLDVNVLGVFLLTRHVSEVLVDAEQQGAVINISSLAGKRGFPNEVDYCTSKAAVIGMTRAMSLDLAAKGITVNAVAPAMVETDMLDAVVEGISRATGLSDEEQRATLVREIPIGRAVRPEEVAAAVTFLASQGARAITGETISVDGGLSRD